MLVQIQKERKKRVSGAHYMLIYQGLQLMISSNTPVSKYRITNRKAVLDIMIENGLIETSERKISTEHRGSKASNYYVITQKGYEYLSIFEKLEDLFN
jgi:hypothetical protein